MMKKLFKKALSLALSCLLIISAVPIGLFSINAFAEDTPLGTVTYPASWTTANFEIFKSQNSVFSGTDPLTNGLTTETWEDAVQNKHLYASGVLRHENNAGWEYTNVSAEANKYLTTVVNTIKQYRNFEMTVSYTMRDGDYLYPGILFGANVPTTWGVETSGWLAGLAFNGEGSVKPSIEGYDHSTGQYVVDTPATFDDGAWNTSKKYTFKLKVDGTTATVSVEQSATSTAFSQTFSIPEDYAGGYVGLALRGARYYIWSVEIVDYGGDVVNTECKHSFSNACDNICDFCGEITQPKHIYDGMDDYSCNTCGEERILKSEAYYYNFGSVAAKEKVKTDFDVYHSTDILAEGAEMNRVDFDSHFEVLSDSIRHIPVVAEGMTDYWEKWCKNSTRLIFNKKKLRNFQLEYNYVTLEADGGNDWCLVDGFFGADQPEIISGDGGAVGISFDLDANNKYAYMNGFERTSQSVSMFYGAKHEASVKIYVENGVGKITLKQYGVENTATFTVPESYDGGYVGFQLYPAKQTIYNIVIRDLDEMARDEMCNHKYDDTYDASCNTCGAIRQVSGDADKYSYTMSYLGYASITSANANLAGETVVPSMMGGYPVEAVGTRAFQTCDQVTSVILPNTVESLYDYAFYDCLNLTKIKIPNSVLSIGDYAFANCYNLARVEIPDSISVIPQRAFSYCQGLTSVKIPDSVVEIESNAFVRCESLKSITIPESVVRINSYAFSMCKGLESVSIPYGVTRIDDYAFEYCTGLADVSISNSVEHIGAGAFRNCKSLVEITIPANVSYMPASVFMNCEKLEAVNIAPENENFASIDGVWFDKDLTKIILYPRNKTGTSYTVPYGVTNISSFDKNQKITSITLPDSVVKIEGNAFLDTNIETVYYVGNKSDAEKMVIGSLNDAIVNATWHYNECVGDHVYDNPCDNCCNVCGEERVTSHIYDNNSDAECNNCGSVRYYEYSVSGGKVHIDEVDPETSGDIVLPLTLGGYPVKEIEGSAFSYCQKITSITFSTNITRIEYGAFDNCNSLKTVYFCGTEEELEEIYIAGGNEYLLNATWYYNVCIGGVPHTYDDVCDGMCDVCSTPRKAPHSYDHADDFTCNDCGYVRYYTFTVENGEVTITDVDSELVGGITVPSTINGLPVKHIGDGAFYDCNEITTIIVPKSVSSIGNFAFNSCDNLVSISILDGVTTIGESAFEYCAKLESVVLPDSLASIGDRAFEYCTSLKTIKIPEGVTEIGEAIFYYCTSLEKITVDANNESFYALEGVLFKREPATLVVFPQAQTRTSYTVPKGIEHIAEHAFANCQNLTTVILQEGLQSLGEGAFSSCYSLTSITVPKSAKVVADTSFYSAKRYNVNVYFRGNWNDLYKDLGKWEEAFPYDKNVWHFNSCNGTAEHTFTDDHDFVCNVCEECRPLGDANGDDWVNKDDCDALNMVLLKKDEYNIVLDMNKDGKIDVIDGIMLRKIIG